MQKVTPALQSSTLPHCLSWEVPRSSTLLAAPGDRKDSTSHLLHQSPHVENPACLNQGAEAPLQFLALRPHHAEPDLKHHADQHLCPTSSVFQDYSKARGLYRTPATPHREAPVSCPSCPQNPHEESRLWAPDA